MLKVIIVLFWAHCDRMGFSGKDNNVGKFRRPKEKRKTKYEMDGLSKRDQV